MAVTTKWYGLGLKSLQMGTIAWKATAGDTIKVALCTSTYSPNQDTHDFFDDITNEVVGAGYTAGGATLTLLDPAYTADGNIAAIDADDVQWTASSLTARYAIIYKSTGTAGTSPLIGYMDFGEDKTSVSGILKIAWDAAGILKIVAS